MKKQNHKTQKCNYCGELIKQAVDVEPPLLVRHKFGYSSKRDLDILNLTLCADCTEHWTLRLVAECAITPIIKNKFVDAI